MRKFKPMASQPRLILSKQRSNEKDNLSGGINPACKDMQEPELRAIPNGETGIKRTILIRLVGRRRYPPGSRIRPLPAKKTLMT